MGHGERSTGNVVDRPVVAGVDRSASALRAALWAADEAGRRRAPLRLVYAVNLSALALTDKFGSSRCLFEALMSDGRQQLAATEAAIRQTQPGLSVETDLQTQGSVPALVELSRDARLIATGSRGLRELLAERLAGWESRYPDITVRRVVTGGRPVRSLLKPAADAQLLTVGSRGRGGISGMLLGSTSHALIHHPPCPLLVVRPPAPGAVGPVTCGFGHQRLKRP
jgi:nucleotide-binding universal stress UspA family protein